MSEDLAPERVTVIWSPNARTNLWASERDIAMQVLYWINRYLASRKGDVKKQAQAAADWLPSTLWRLPGVLRPETREHDRHHQR